MDLESQRRAYNNWGKNDLVPRVCASPANLTPAQRDAATHGYAVASDLLPYLDAGHRFFTAYRINCKPDNLEPLVASGVIIKHKSTEHDGYYYRATPITRPWCFTALALRDDRVRALKERAPDGQGNG